MNLNELCNDLATRAERIARDYCGRELTAYRDPAAHCSRIADRIIALRTNEAREQAPVSLFCRNCGERYPRHDGRADCLKCGTGSESAIAVPAAGGAL